MPRLRRQVLTSGSVSGSSIHIKSRSAKFPLKVSSNGRYFLRANGQPFFMVADSPQALAVNLAATDNFTTTDAGAYLAKRKSQGFNTIWVNIVCNDYTGGRANGSTFDGIVPFNSTLGGGQYNITDPKATYWARMDTFINLTATYGFLIVVDPIETGGWLTTLSANGVTACTTYGQWLGNRYRGFKNIVWMNGNDYNLQAVPSATDDSYVQAVAQGIRSVMPSALQTVELFFFTSSSFDDSRWIGSIDYNCVYQYDPQYQRLLSDYNRVSYLPNVYIEGSYEHEQNSPANGTPLGTPLEMRRQAYFSLTSGATGFFYGEHNTWQFLSGWQTYMGAPNSPGADHVGLVSAFINGRAWQNLVPDQANALITAGKGTFGATSYVTAGKTPDGTLGIAYVPFVTDVTVNLAQMAGPVTARWFDPTSGAYSSAGSGLSGSHIFTHPGNNAGGDPDRVLLLEA